MADTTQVVGTNDKGQHVVNIPRSDIARIDVVDIDFVVQTKSGARLIIPGAAMDAMSPTPPSIQFADGPFNSAQMLSAVQRVETPPNSIPVMSSLTEQEMKKSEGNKKVQRDGPEGRQAEAEAAAQEAQSHQVAPLPTGAADSSVDKLVAKAEQISEDISKKAFDPGTHKKFDEPAPNPAPPGEAPKTAKIPVLTVLSEGNVVDDETNVAYTSADLGNGGGRIFYGYAGPTKTGTNSGILPGDAAQYGQETLTGTAYDDIILADGLKGLAGGRNNLQTTYDNLNKETGLSADPLHPTAFYYAKELEFNLAGYVRRLTSVTVTGLPDGVYLEGAIPASNAWIIPNSSVIPTKAFNIVYDVTAMRAMFPAGSDHVDIKVSFHVKAVSTDTVSITKTFILRFQDVDSTDDITNNNPIYVTGAGKGWSDIYVMPTASAPHLIKAQAGNNQVYAGNSNDTINAGAGNDTVYAYAGNDIIDIGDGANTVWAGNGTDTVITGIGNDVIYAGSGNNDITAGAGNNTVTAGDGNDTVTSGSGNDNLTLGGGFNHVTDAGGNNTIRMTGYGSVTITGTGTDTIEMGDGAFYVQTGDGDKTVTIGNGDGSVTTGAGNDTVRIGSGLHVINVGEGLNTVSITAGDGNDTVTAGASKDIIDVGAGANVVTAGDGDNTVTTGDGDDTIYADALVTAGTVTHVGTGENLIYANDGKNSIWTGSGKDVIYAGVTVDAGTGTITSVGTGNNTIIDAGGANTITTGNGADHVTTGGGDDVLVLGDGDNIVFAGAGTNSITGGSGKDVLVGGGGVDSIRAGAGDDTLYGGDGSNTMLDGGAGTDWLSFNGIGSAVVDGATILDDWLTYAGGTTGVSLALSASGGGSATHGTDTDTVSSIENLIGSGGTDMLDVQSYIGIAHTLYGLAGNDTLIGADKADLLDGGAGNDTITGGAGTDTLKGGAGDDVFLFTSNDGADDYDGGAGTDKVSYWNEGAGITINLSTATTGLGGSALGDTYTSIEWIVGGSAGDNLTGSSGSDTLEGGGGDDIIYAGTAVGTGVNDFLYGDVRNADGSSGSSSGTVVYLLANWSNPSNWSNNNIVASGTNWGNQNYNGDRLYGSNVANSTTTMYGGSGYNQYFLQSETDVVNGGTNDTTDVDRIIYSNQNVAGTVAATGLANTGVFVNIDNVSHKWDITGAVDTGSNGYWWNGSAFVQMTGTTAFNAVNANSGQYGWAAGDTYDNIEQVTGTKYADVIFGNGEGNVISAGDGNDAVFGMGGDEWIFYSNGTDYIDGGDNNNVTLPIGGDVVDYSGFNASATAVLSVDLSHTAGYVKVNGLSTTGGAAQLRNVEGFIGSGHGDFVTGSSYADRIDPRGGHDSVNAGAGADIVYGGWGGSTGSGRDVLDGGSGIGSDLSADSDWISYSGISALGANSLGIEVYLAKADIDASGTTDEIPTGFSDTQGYSRYDTYEIDTLSNFENVEGSNYDDRIAGNSGANIIYGLTGNDTIFGGGGGDSINGGGGTDTITYYNSTGLVSVTVDLDGTNGGSAGGAAGDTFVSVENVVGTVLGDIIYGNASDNQIDGKAGNDSLYGGSGSDTLIGSTGDDLLNGGAGNDMASYAYVTSTTTSVVANLTTNTATVGSSGDNDTFASIENLRGGSGSDTLTGSAAVNTIYGGAGNDSIVGTAGADSLYGETGNDKFVFTNATLSTTSIISGGAAGAAETDRITVTDTWTFAANSFNTTNQNNKYVSIEEIYARDGVANSSFGLNSSDIQSIVDNGAASILTLYLDTGDKLTTSSFSQAGSDSIAFTSGAGLAAGTYHLTYAGGPQLTLEVGIPGP